MNIAMKNAKQKKRRTPQQMLLAGVMLFFFTAFLLLFVQSPSLLTAAMALLVPLAVWAMVRILPRLFPMDEFLLTLIAFLCALGVLLQYRYTPSRGLTQAFNCGAGLVAMVVCALAVRHIKSCRLLIVPLMGLSCALMSLPFVFRAVNAGKGATAWVGFGGFTVQPSELVKIVYLFVLSYLLSRRRIVTGMIFIGLMLGFLVLQRDLGTAAIYGGAGLVLLYAATSSLLLIGGILGAGVGAVAVLYALFKNSYFLTVQNRISNWLDPFSTYDQLGGGYQIVQSLIAIANGGWWGTGLGLGNASVIPEFRTDFIFSALINEFGLVFAALVACVYVLIVLRSADIALRSTSAFHALLAAGSAAPFLSYGGTSLVSCLGLMGAVQGVASRNERLLREDQRLAEGGEDAQ